MKFFSKSKKKEEREETLDIKHYTYLKENYQKLLQHLLRYCLLTQMD